MKIKISLVNLVSLIVLLSCLDISYLNGYIPMFDQILFILRLCLLLFMLIFYAFNRKPFSMTLIATTISMIWILVISVMNKLDFIYVIKLLSIAYLPVLYLDLYRNSSALIVVLDTWKYLLFILLLIDLTTMIIYPSGMYSDGVYSMNWFLGYKTLRLIYLLPLCIFEGYTSFFKKKKSILTYLIYLLSVYSLYYTQALAATVTLAFVCVILVSYSILVKFKLILSLFKVLSKPKIIVPIYGTIVFLTVVAQNSPLIEWILINVLQRDITLTTRTFLWTKVLEIIRGHELMGIGFLSVNEYSELLGTVYFTSPHNMILSILVTGGIILLAMYTLVIFISWGKVNVKDNNVNFFAVIGIIAIWFVGITSSIMVFSFCGFIFYILMISDPYSHNIEGEK